MALTFNQAKQSYDVYLDRVECEAQLLDSKYGTKNKQKRATWALVDLAFIVDTRSISIMAHDWGCLVVQRDGRVVTFGR
jgi:hypothetical protein